jgi:DNA-directed RNA polymerase specialized sigma24 family protein
VDSESVTHWIEQIKQGAEGSAQQELWDRYFARLVALARSKLRDLPARARDEEDVALSALHSFFQRAREGRFPQLKDRTDLWPLLAKITVRKSINRRRQHFAQKRGLGQVRGESVFGKKAFDEIVGEDAPTPAMMAAISEYCQQLFQLLDPDLRVVARMKLEGYTNLEIAKRLGRVERTVERKLEVIRRTWCKELDRP